MDNALGIIQKNSRHHKEKPLPTNIHHPPLPTVPSAHLVDYYYCSDAALPIALDGWMDVFGGKKSRAQQRRSSHVSLVASYCDFDCRGIVSIFHHHHNDDSRGFPSPPPPPPPPIQTLSSKVEGGVVGEAKRQ